jgi:hypothetical protein
MTDASRIIWLASEKRQGMKSRAVARWSGSEVWDLILTRAVMTSAILAEVDLDACSVGCLKEWNGVRGVA